MSSKVLTSSNASRPPQERSRSQSGGILTPASDRALNRQRLTQGPTPTSAVPLKRTGSALLSGAIEETGVVVLKKPQRPGAPRLPMEELLKPSIVIKPYPSTLVAKPVTLQPLMLLPRECLPLSAIDLSSPHGELPASRLYESRIRIMELEGRLGSNVLVARSECSSRRFTYAIERDDRGHYVVCKLGGWVDVADLGTHATVMCKQRMAARPSSSKVVAAVTVGSFEPTLVTPQIYKDSKRKRQAIEDLQSVVRKRPRSQSVASLAAQQSQQQHAVQTQQFPTPVDDNAVGSIPNNLDTADGPFEARSQPGSGSGSGPETAQEVSQLLTPRPPAPAEVSETQQTAENIFQNIRTQYFETLYHSMGSLAYFAKGPLSRARAAFHLNCDSNLEMSDLIGFLKSLVLTTVLIDKKYLSAIPEMIDQMKLLVESSDEEARHGTDPRASARKKQQQQQQSQTQLKKKKKKQAKLGRNGLYPAEEGGIKRWWIGAKPELRDDETSVSSEQVRYHVSCLRRRETLLQMILILEILALEAAGVRPPEGRAEVQLPGLAAAAAATVTDEGADANVQVTTAKKKRSKHNYPVLLDVHADRLCIWESTTLDEVRMLAESQARQGEMRRSDKPLQDFCVDVILPFFSARLPNLCDSLYRKLGGPAIPSPPRQRRDKAAASSSAKTRPGAPTRRPGPQTTGKPATAAKTLERVLSNDRLRRSVPRGGPSDAIAHLRNATIAPIPGLKREGSDSILQSLRDVAPFKPSRAASAGGAAAESRGSSESLKERPGSSSSRSRGSSNAMLLSRSSSFTSVEELKARKKAAVEAELKDAISTLKRPNRELVGKVMVEETERRLFGGPTWVKKSKKPTRTTGSGSANGNPVDRVQVKATPANNRFKDVLAAEPHAALTGGRALFNDGGGGNAHQPSSLLLQPSAAVRRGPVVEGATSHFPPGPHLGGSPRVASTPLVRKTYHYGGGAAAIPGRVAIAAGFVAADDFVPTSSPLLARDAPPASPPPPPPSWAASGRHISAVPGRLHGRGGQAIDLVPASSPLQACGGGGSVDPGSASDTSVPRVVTPSRVAASPPPPTTTAAGPLSETPVRPRQRAGLVVVESTPLKGSFAAAAAATAATPPVSATTPVRQPIAAHQPHQGAVVVEEAAGKARKLSIYQQLGWDDDDLDDLA